MRADVGSSETVTPLHVDCQQIRTQGFRDRSLCQNVFHSFLLPDYWTCYNSHTSFNRKKTAGRRDENHLYPTDKRLQVTFVLQVVLQSTHKRFGFEVSKEDSLKNNHLLSTKLLSKYSSRSKQLLRKILLFLFPLIKNG